MRNRPTPDFVKNKKNPSPSKGLKLLHNCPPYFVRASDGSVSTEKTAYPRWIWGRECEKASGAWRPQPWSSSLARPKFPISRQENTLGWEIKEFRGFEVHTLQTITFFISAAISLALSCSPNIFTNSQISNPLTCSRHQSPKIRIPIVQILCFDFFNDSATNNLR